MPKPFVFDSYPVSLARRAPFGQPTRAAIDHWHDGDTCWVTIDAQWNEYPFRKIRLRGVNAPELATVEGASALAWIDALAPPFTPVVIEGSVKLTGRVQDQSEDRYVARIILENGCDLGAALVAAGHAVLAKE